MRLKKLFVPLAALASLVGAVFMWRGYASRGISFSKDFDSGSVNEIGVDLDGTIRFSLEPDPGDKSERLWFYFRVDSESSIQPWFLLDEENHTHQGPWHTVRPVFSRDGKSWERAKEVSSKSDLADRLLRRRKPRLHFRAPFAAKTMWVAFAFPYPPAMLEELLADLKQHPELESSWLTKSAHGVPVRLLEVKRPGPELAKDVVWIVAREHPGESHSSYVMDGLLRALFDSPEGEQLLDRYDFKIAPMINAEGVTEGRYYRNGEGIDLAQDWKTFASKEMSALYQAMRPDLEAKRTAVLLNLHSANYPKGHFFLETNKDWLAPRLQEQQKQLFKAASSRHPQLQQHTTVKTWDYPIIASNYLNTEHGVYCFYQESNYNLGDDDSIVTPESLRRVGLALVQALAEVKPESPRTAEKRKTSESQPHQ